MTGLLFVVDGLGNREHKSICMGRVEVTVQQHRLRMDPQGISYGICNRGNSIHSGTGVRPG